MKPTLLLVLLSIILSVPVLGQADSIYLHAGRVIGGNVQSVQQHTVSYTTWSSEALRIISRHAVQKIVYSEGREETLSPFVTIRGAGDWEKVEILQDKTATAGLTYAGETDATGGGKFIDSVQADKQALIALRKDAARRQCPFIYISGSRMQAAGHVGRRIRKSAVAYKY